MTSTLLEANSVHKILEVDSHVAAAISGLTPDAQAMVDYGRVECQSHRFTYDEPLRVESLTQALCDLALSFGEGSEGSSKAKSKMSRPFGVALLIAGVDARGPQLYSMDPSGTYTAFDAQVCQGGGGGGRAAALLARPPSRPSPARPVRRRSAAAPRPRARRCRSATRRA